MPSDTDTEKELYAEMRRNGDLEAALRFVATILKDENFPRARIISYIRETLHSVGLSK